MVVVVEGKIQGKDRPRFGGKGKIYTNTKTSNYETLVRFCYRTQAGEFFKGPIKTSIVIYKKIPKSYSKKKKESLGIYSMATPDLDNVGKVILDALNTVAYEDDRQVVDLRVVRFWTNDFERVEFEISEI